MPVTIQEADGSNISLKYARRTHTSHDGNKVIISLHHWRVVSFLILVFFLFFLNRLHSERLILYFCRLKLMERAI